MIITITVAPPLPQQRALPVVRWFVLDRRNLLVKIGQGAHKFIVWQYRTITQQASSSQQARQA